MLTLGLLQMIQHHWLPQLNGLMLIGLLFNYLMPLHVLEFSQLKKKKKLVSVSKLHLKLKWSLQLLININIAEKKVNSLKIVVEEVLVEMKKKKKKVRKVVPLVVKKKKNLVDALEKSKDGLSPLLPSDLKL